MKRSPAQTPDQAARDAIRANYWKRQRALAVKADRERRYAKLGRLTMRWMRASAFESPMVRADAYGRMVDLCTEMHRRPKKGKRS